MEPPGGPEDKTPPAIIVIRPQNGSTMLPADASFRITFSENMRREKVEGAIFLSPIFWDYPDLKWSGKTLTVSPPERLKPNTTYILTIGADATDFVGNRMGRSQSFVFSTGPAIDSGSIAGNVYYISTQQTIYDIWGYTISDTVIDFMRRIPDHATQVDSAGRFALEHLGPGRFLVICVNDKNDDLFWDPSAEELGLPPAIIGLNAQENISGLVFRPEMMDTAAGYVTAASPINQQRIEIGLSEPLMEGTAPLPGNFRIGLIDSDSVLLINSVYSAEESKLILDTEPMVPDKTYQIVPLGLNNQRGILFDTSGVRFAGIDEPDTVGPKVISVFPPDRSTAVYQDSVIDITLSERILAVPFVNAATVVTDSLDTLRYTVTWPLPNVARLHFARGMPRETRINLELDPDRVVDIARNSMTDSATGVWFRLPPADTVGAALAQITDPGRGRFIGSLIPMNRGGESYKGSFDQSGRFILNTVIPGAYRFEFFEDSDGNDYWTPGSVNPFGPAESFSFLPDTVRIRSRWETDIGNVNAPEIRH
jgi:hypothetical protein